MLSVGRGNGFTDTRQPVRVPSTVRTAEVGGNRYSAKPSRHIRMNGKCIKSGCGGQSPWRRKMADNQSVKQENSSC